MNPDVVAAIVRLREASILAGPQAELFGRVARRDLVSIRLEIRVLLYAGVLLLTSGVGLFVSEHHRDIGPATVVVGVGLAAALCLFWVARRATPFSWGEAPSPTVAFDYVLLLGLLLLASDLAYTEVQFTLLGPSWPRHLLIVATIYLVAAYRWDSRTVLALALTTLAAWRGISYGVVQGSIWRADAVDLRLDAIALGATFVAVAAASVALARKAHFEAVFANAGVLLLLGALLSGALARHPAWSLWLVALLVVSGLVMWLSFRFRRPLYFAQGVVAAYLGLLRLVLAPFRFAVSSLTLLLAALLGAAAIAVISATHRRMGER